MLGDPDLPFGGTLMPWKVERRKGKFVVLRDDGKLVAEHDTKQKAMAQMRALYASEYWLKKARTRQFASRSEAGKYAAHIRWAQSRGEQPMSLEQWRSNQGQPTETQLAGMELVRMRLGEAQQAMAGVEQRSKEFLAGPYKDADGYQLGEDDPVAGKIYATTRGAVMKDDSVEEWERASQAGTNFVLTAKGELVPSKALVEAMEKVKAVGSAIEAEAQARAARTVARNFR